MNYYNSSVVLGNYDFVRQEDVNIMDVQDFWMGNAFDAYTYFGANKENDGIRFRVFAPSARDVKLIGDFNGWQEQSMDKEKGGFFTVFSTDAKVGMKYKYVIYTCSGQRVEHCDPYGFQMELRPACASVITDLNTYIFRDEAWMKYRSVCYDLPLNIYEVHLGSWMRKKFEDNSWHTYEELADLLIPYVKENHYTHIEFMPLSEHPFDGSWGYQNTGFYAPTARYGTPEQLKYLIDKCHEAYIGVILDFVPVHFAVDDYGLKMFDGTALYEYPSSDVGQSEWGSCNFIHSRREVRCFLQSCANYWLKEFHIDGIRMDAVSRLIYWQGDERRGVNGQTVEFVRNMNSGLRKMHPSAILIAEDSSHYDGTTKAVQDGGLGFDYKWDLGWMHDTLDYFALKPEYRTENYHRLTFSMMYFYNERHMLPFSHDEVVHGKGTILEKMYGDEAEKFSQLKTLYMYMAVHPGKMLNFMGNELAQYDEWNEEQEISWELLSDPKHSTFHHYMEILNKIFLENRAFHCDYDPNNFIWLDCDCAEKCIYAIKREAENSRFAAVFNLSNKQQQYELVLKKPETFELTLHTEWKRFGGTKEEYYEKYISVSKDKKQSLSLTCLPYSAMLFKIL